MSDPESKKRDEFLFLCTIIFRDLWKVCFVGGAMWLFTYSLFQTFKQWSAMKINIGRIQGRVYNFSVGMHVGLWNGG